MERGSAGSLHVARSGQHDVSVQVAPRKVLCVGDSRHIRTHLAQMSKSGWKMAFVRDMEAASMTLQVHHDIRVALARLNTENCRALEELVAGHSHVKWVAVTDDSDMEDATVRRVLSGMFYDYHTLPVEPDRLSVILGHAYGMAALHRATLEDEPYSARDKMRWHDMIGISDKMRAIYSTIDKVAQTDFPVLITGKSGTGKELVARALHHRSDRSDQPLVVMNCGAVVPSLIQSELFGHEKGSFTDASTHREGQFEAAHGGTIFLDEIAELPLETQANLLRVLEDKVVRRVGGTTNISVDVRVLAATNRDLSDAVAAGKFREDLLYRLSVVHVEIPPLSERRSDIQALAEHYLDKFAADVKSKARGFSRNAIESMLAHGWPGNVRELINRIKRAALMCENRLIGPEDLGLTPPRASEGDGNLDWMTLRKVKEEAERNALVETMSKANSNISLAAQRLGVSRVTLYNLLKKYDLR